MTYSSDLMQLAANPLRQGHLPPPKQTSECVSRLCGSHIRVDLRIEEGRIVDFAHETQACLFGLATCAILSKNIIGCTAEEIKALRQALSLMLKHNGPPPSEVRWRDFALLMEARAYPTRHPSILLILDCIVKALENV